MLSQPASGVRRPLVHFGNRGAFLRRSIGALLSVVVLAGCAQAPSIPPTAPVEQASVEPGSPDPSQRPSATPASTPGPQASPIAGVWRVRRALAPGGRGALIPTAAYGDEAYDIKPQCPTEPCDRIEIKATPLGLPEPVTVTVLDRDENTYISPAASGDGQCINDEGDRVPGGAAVRSSLRVWIAAVRQAGTAVDVTQLTGRLEIQLTPTAIGEASGCEPQTASYDLSGRRENVAVRSGGADPEETPPPGSGLVALPSIGIKVPGSSIDYFPVQGDTVSELAAAISRGGVKACGEIEYEWFRGDARPSACTVTQFADLEGSMVTSGDPSSSTCTIKRATVAAEFTIHFPRWTKPQRVPEPLLRWWGEIVTFIRDHEAGHVDISRKQVKTLNTRLTGAKCTAANSIIRKWAGQFSAAQEAFDRREYQKPWPVPPPGY